MYNNPYTPHMRLSCKFLKKTVALMCTRFHDIQIYSRQDPHAQSNWLAEPGSEKHLGMTDRCKLQHLHSTDGTNQIHPSLIARSRVGERGNSRTGVTAAYQRGRKEARCATILTLFSSHTHTHSAPMRVHTMYIYIGHLLYIVSLLWPHAK